MRCFQVFGREELVWEELKKKNQFLQRDVKNQPTIEHAFKLAESLRALAETYAKKHSIFREKDYRLDPGYTSLNLLANNLSNTETYQQAVIASRRGAKKVDH